MPKRIYVGKLKDQIEQWEKEIIRLKKEAGTDVGDVKVKYEGQIKELQSKIIDAEKTSSRSVTDRDTGWEWRILKGVSKVKIQFRYKNIPI